MTAADLIRPLLLGRPAEWHGLPPTLVAGIDDSLGAPAAVEPSELGYYPAERRLYPVEGREAIVWARKGVAVMIEVPGPFSPASLTGLEPPCAVLANEISVPGGYAQERLFCGRGLVATVVEPFGAGAGEVLRLRGIAPIAMPAQFGPELYKAFEDQVRWVAP
jgi:hypothetical protein